MRITKQPNETHTEYIHRIITSNGLTPFQPTPELEAIESQIILRAKEWITQRDLVAQNRTQLAHLAMDAGIIKPEESLTPTKVQNTHLEGSYHLLYGSDGFAKATTILARQVDKAVKEHPIADWITNTQGLSYKAIGELMKLVGNLWNYPKVSSLWTRMALNVENGRHPKRKRGEFFGYNTKCKGWAYNQGVVIVKAKDCQKLNRPEHAYRHKYVQAKNHYMSKPPTGPSQCRLGQVHKTSEGKVHMCSSTELNAGHAEAASRTKAVKAMLKDIWVVYHKTLGTGFAEYQEEQLRKRGVVLDHVPGVSRGVG